MRDIITINAYALPLNKNNPNYDILSVRYIVSKDPTFLNTAAKVIETVKVKADATMLSFSFEYTFEKEESLYGKVVYYYPGNNSEESSVCELEHNQLGFSFNNNIINTPDVKIKDFSSYSNMLTGDFTIEADDMLMFMGHGEHTQSSWKIKDSEENIVFESLEDEFNLTSIYVPENTLKENRIYRIELIYHNNYTSKSYPGILDISTYGTDKLYHIVEDSLRLYDKGLSTLSYYQNLPGFIHCSINIEDSVGNLMLENFITTEDVVKIPVIDMSAGSRYYVNVSFRYKNHDGDERSTNIIKLTGICAEYVQGEEYFPEYKYNNVLKNIKHNLSFPSFPNNSILNGTTEQLDNGDILFVSLASASKLQCDFYKYTSNDIIYTGRGFTIDVSARGTIDTTKGVNSKILLDRTSGKNRLILSYSVLDSNNVSKLELISYHFYLGQYGNIDLVNNPNILQLPNKYNISNSEPIIDYTNDSFILLTNTVSTADKNEFLSIKKDVSAYSNITTLRDNDLVSNTNSAASAFQLPDNKMLVIRSNKQPMTYGIFDKTTNAYANKGTLKSELQNLNELGKNMFFGHVLLNGNVLIIPHTKNKNNFNIFIFNATTEQFEKVIDNSNILLSSAYGGVNPITSKAVTVKLNNGNFIIILHVEDSGDTYRDLWEFK